MPSRSILICLACSRIVTVHSPQARRSFSSNYELKKEKGRKAIRAKRSESESAVLYSCRGANSACVTINMNAESGTDVRQENEKGQ